MKQYLTDSFSSNFAIDAEEEHLFDNISLREKKLKKHETLFSVGENFEYVFCVCEGWVTARVDLEKGSRQLLNFWVPIDIGGLHFLSTKVATSTLVAHQDSKLILFSAHEFERALERSAKSSLAMLKAAGRRTLLLEDRLCVFARGDARAKLGHFLLSLHAKQVRNSFENAEQIRLPLNQPDIGDALGLSPVTVSREFTKLAEEGVVRYERKRITILDLELLRACVAEVRGSEVPLKMLS